MSKYVKELMMDQLKSELNGDRSVLILDFKNLTAQAENELRLDLRKKNIQMRSLKNTLARRVFESEGLGGLKQFLEGPSVAVWGGDGVAELAKEISGWVKKLEKPTIKGGAVDGTIIGPSQVEDITKLPSREELIARVVNLALSPVRRVVTLANSPAANLVGQLKTLAEGAPQPRRARPPRPPKGPEPRPVCCNIPDLRRASFVFSRSLDRRIARTSFVLICRVRTTHQRNFPEPNTARLQTRLCPRERKDRRTDGHRCCPDH